MQQPNNNNLQQPTTYITDPLQTENAWFEPDSEQEGGGGGEEEDKRAAVERKSVLKKSRGILVEMVSRKTIRPTSR